MIQVLRSLPASHLSIGAVFDAVAATGHVPAMQWLLDQATTPSWSPNTCAAAAYGGHLPMLKLLRSQGCPWDAKACRYACKASNLTVLAWLRQQRPPCPWTSACYVECSKAARLRDPGAPERMVDWMRTQKPPCPWTPECCMHACKPGSGLVSLLHWLAADSPFTWSREHCQAAVNMQAKPMMEELLGQQQLQSDPVKANRIRAIQKMLSRAYEQYGKSWEGDLDYLNPAILAMPELRAAAGERGQWAMLRWLLDQPCQGPGFAQAAFNAAVQNDQPEVIQYILSRSRPGVLTFPECLDPQACSARCLLILAKAGCPMRQRYPHRIEELVSAWHVFVNVVKSAQAASPRHLHPGGHAPRRMLRKHLSSATGDELLSFLAELPSEVSGKIADMAFLSPTDAEKVH